MNDERLWAIWGVLVGWTILALALWAGIATHHVSVFWQ